MQLAAMGRYGLEPSYEGFNPLKHPWEASGSVNWSWPVPSTNKDFPHFSMVLMRGLYPILETFPCQSPGLSPPK